MPSKVDTVWALVVVDPDGGESLVVQCAPSHGAIFPTLTVEPDSRDRFLRQAQDLSNRCGQTVRVLELTYSRELQCFHPSADGLLS